MLTTTRMQEIMVDVDLDRPRTGYTPEENAFRDKVEVQMADAHTKGQSLDFTQELP
jgi:hypothetical protein